MEDCRNCEFKEGCSIDMSDPIYVSKTIDNVSYFEHVVAPLPMNLFYKVSYEQFLKDCTINLRKLPFYKLYTDEEFERRMKEAYDHIRLPRRSTSGSAGYDFYLPFDSIPLFNNEPVVIPTGIKMELTPGCFLGLFPRSSYGYKYGMRLENTVGIIDADYYNNPDNEGHISAKVSIHPYTPNDSAIKSPELPLVRGDRYMQGIIMGHAITADDYPISNKREGGVGSTGN